MKLKKLSSVLTCPRTIKLATVLEIILPQSSYDGACVFLTVLISAFLHFDASGASIVSQIKYKLLTFMWV